MSTETFGHFISKSREPTYALKGSKRSAILLKAPIFSTHLSNKKQNPIET